ncbi:nuclear RNA export factor 1 [Hydra vulgaris]|uniref:Nuclear RNA export factor 1 n=1 Tax=Hydra vulgaris TaxID=6087 RepID=A0ABM4CZ48_HYDVU
MAFRGFKKAVNDANFSVNISSNGTRSIERRLSEGGFENRRYHTDGFENKANTSSYRGSGSGNNGGRWKRGGGFNNRNSGGRGCGKGNFKPKHRFVDDDDDGDARMRDEEHLHRSNYGGSGFGNKERDRDESDWFKVVVPEGKKHNRDWLLNKIKQIAKVSFEEVDYHTFKDNIVFFLKGQMIADAVQSASNIVTTKDGSKLFFTVRPSRPPNNNINKDEKKSSSNTSVETSPEKLEVLKTFLGNRYDVKLVKLDLSNISSEKILFENRIEGHAGNFKFMNTIFTIINSICPQLKSLDLSHNGITRLNTLEFLADKCPELEELNLSRNQIRFSGELTKIASNKKLKRLFLNDNPFSDNYKSDNVAYIAEIRSKLPDIEELDGVVLPKAIKCDLLSESIIPESKPAYAENQDALKLIATFLENYYKIYDSSDASYRQHLLGAYHNDAVFSMSLNTGISSSSKSHSLNDYVKISRNLRRIRERNIRHQLIKQSKLAVVAFLTELPTTTHKLDSFVVDIPVVTPSCLVFTIHGVFLEKKLNILRGFSRVFVSVPETNSQFLIINDELHIRNITDAQLAKFEIKPIEAKEQELLNETKQQELVKQFSLHSKMNLKWSFDCLASNGWNFEQAGIKFTELNNLGKIPPEAFVI